MSDEVENTYWNNKGKYLKEYNKLYRTYITHDIEEFESSRYTSTKIRLTGNRKANVALKSLFCNLYRYRRYYNDGDYPGMGVPAWRGRNPDNIFTPKRERILEEAMDKVILKAWEATRHATIRPTHDINYDHLYCPVPVPPPSRSYRRHY